ncbi:hypothetical protein [Pseudomonas putida]|uniref:hypothetical protein n=1 Tax=Pseudomonas putida TaxID=303 RepID=UPI00275518E9|nr:hypothetical protein [Pseudomonas putida]MDP9523385.1 hypothetical protein [Pseudomonas putida]
MSTNEIHPLDATLNQMNNTLLALSRVLAKVDPIELQAQLGAAVYASRQQGSGDHIVLEVFQKALPGIPLPTVLSEEEFAKKQREAGQ